MDKFVNVMIIFMVALMIIIGGGFIAVEYFKTHPDVFNVQPKNQ